MKRLCVLSIFFFGFISITCHAQITIKLNIPTKSSHQVLAKNFVLRQLLSLSDIVLVESDEQFRIDFLAKEMFSTNDEIVGIAIAAYLMYRVNWDDVKETFVNEEELLPEDSIIFEKLPTDVYFPLLFVSDYCTVEGLRDACVSFVDLFNREHFDKIRERQRNDKQLPP